MKHRTTFLYITLSTLSGIILIFYGKFLSSVQTRPGLQFLDPLFGQWQAHDFTWPIFILIYSTLAVTIVHLLRSRSKELMLKFLFAYALMALVRMAMMSCLPLDPPAGMIALSDPLVELFLGQRTSFTRDLFFSGHTATLSLCLLSFSNLRSRVLIGVATLVMASLMVAQQAHYTVDLLVAPFVAYGCYRMSCLCMRTIS